MSILWLSYIFEQAKDLEGSDLIVALAVADFADVDGLAFPGVDLIAEKARLGKRRTQDIIKGLEVRGYLIIDRKSGRGNKSVFRLQKVQRIAPFTADVTAEKVQSVAPFTENKRCNLASEKVQSSVKKAAHIRNEPFKPSTGKNKIPSSTDKVVTDQEYIFREGVPLLMRDGRPRPSAASILGKWRSKYGDRNVAAAVRDAIKIEASVPVEYVAAVLSKRPADLYAGRSADDVPPVIGSPDCPHCLGSGSVEVENPAAEYSFTRRGFRTCPTCSGGKLENGYEIIKPGPPPILQANSNANV